MNMHFPINTKARFLWKDVSGAMRVSVGSTFDVSRKYISIETQSIPWPGSEVQVIVDLPSTPLGSATGRLVGKGKVVRIEQMSGRAFGFAAEVRFQMLCMRDAVPAATRASDAKALEFPIAACPRPAAMPIDFGSADGNAAFHGLGEPSGQLQSPAA